MPTDNPFASPPPGQIPNPFDSPTQGPKASPEDNRNLFDSLSGVNSLDIGSSRGPGTVQSNTSQQNQQRQLPAQSGFIQQLAVSQIQQTGQGNLMISQSQHQAQAQAQAQRQVQSQSSSNASLLGRQDSFGSSHQVQALVPSTQQSNPYSLPQPSVPQVERESSGYVDSYAQPLPASISATAPAPAPASTFVPSSIQPQPHMPHMQPNQTISQPSRHTMPILSPTQAPPGNGQPAIPSHQPHQPQPQPQLYHYYDDQSNNHFQQPPQPIPASAPFHQDASVNGNSGFANIHPSATAPDGSSRPNAELVVNSGHVMARISFRSILLKKWKQAFWIQYGPHTMLWFRSNADFDEWLNSPHLTQPKRNLLIKLAVNFVHDLYKPNVRGYQVTQARTKSYGKKLVRQFKLERWMDYGPTIAAAFGSVDPREVDGLRQAIVDCMRNTPTGHGIRATGAVRQKPTNYQQPSQERFQRPGLEGQQQSVHSFQSAPQAPLHHHTYGHGLYVAPVQSSRSVSESAGSVGDLLGIGTSHDDQSVGGHSGQSAGAYSSSSAPLYTPAPVQRYYNDDQIRPNYQQSFPQGYQQPQQYQSFQEPPQIAHHT